MSTNTGDIELELKLQGNQANLDAMVAARREENGKNIKRFVNEHIVNNK